jgi:uncharacterized protein YjbI with pentapeptide repeats
MSKYQVVRELGYNREGGRITYLATDTSLNPPQEVVIKEFRFATSDANWSGFKAYQREIEILQQLDHPRIPRYLDSYETNTGFCLVQEYKKAPSLAQQRSFNFEEIKQIAISVLEILVYLQKRTPAVIHRDIKPENILVDKQPILFSIKQGEQQKSKLPLTAYLVDFGFARIRDGELALSSVAAGTPGFMPPEEQFGRTLTEASDLYSLGATLICLLTGTRSVDVGKLIDDDYRFNFKKLVPKVSPHFISWLEKMVAPNVKQRYANAAEALEALKRPVFVGDRAKTNRRAAVVLGLIFFTSISTILMKSQPESSGSRTFDEQISVNKLLETKECPKCYLVNVNLSSANLSGANLWSADLSRADLSRADLSRAQLSGANLSRVQLSGANLLGAILSRANLLGAKLSGADLSGAELSPAYLSGAIMSGANLSGAILSGSNLSSANLSGSNLSSANLLGAILSRANLSRANLGIANLSSANLSGAILLGANLSGANLSGAYLLDANLEGADLRDANLKNAKLNGANLKNAIMPDGTKHP